MTKIVISASHVNLERRKTRGTGMEPSRVARKLLSAFKKVVRPSSSDWVTGLSWQDDDILHALTSGRRVNDSFIEDFRDCLPNFTLGAKLFVIPRYLIYVIRFPDRDVTDFLINELSRLVRDQSFLRAITTEQAHAIIAGLNFLEPHIRQNGSPMTYTNLSFALSALRKIR